MNYIIKLFNNILCSSNKIQVKPEIIEKNYLKKEKEKENIIENIFDFKVLSDSQLTIFKSLSKKSLLELLNAFNKNQKHIIEVLNDDFNKTPVKYHYLDKSI